MLPLRSEFLGRKNLIFSQEFNLLDSKRVFVKEGDVSVKRGSKASKDAHLFLFSDLLVCSTPLPPTTPSTHPQLPPIKKKLFGKAKPGNTFTAKEALKLSSLLWSASNASETLRRGDSTPVLRKESLKKQDKEAREFRLVLMPQNCIYRIRTQTQSDCSDWLDALNPLRDANPPESPLHTPTSILGTTLLPV